MKAKSILLTVPLAVSALTVLTLPANAVCWSWKPCADMQGYGYGYGVQTEFAVRVAAAAAGRLGATRNGSRTGFSPGGHGSARGSGEAEACRQAFGDGDCRTRSRAGEAQA
jgi:hypothetical protein